MPNHSAEAIAELKAMRERLGVKSRVDDVDEMWLDASDRGASSQAAQQYAATREALAKVIYETKWPENADSVNYALAIADALLAEGGPLVDVREVRGEVIDWIDDNFYDNRENGETIPQEARAHFGIESRA